MRVAFQYCTAGYRKMIRKSVISIGICLSMAVVAPLVAGPGVTQIRTVGPTVQHLLHRGLRDLAFSNYAMAIGPLKKASDLGSPRAALALGNLYESGKGVASDPLKALALYRFAASKGNADAMTAMGRCYESGLGVRKDPVSAAEWYLRAVLHGDMRALPGLKAMCHGPGLSKKWMGDAYRRLTVSARGGDASAMFVLSELLDSGLMVGEDPAAAAVWRHKAAKAGDTWAMVMLGTNEDIMKHDYARAAYWYSKAAKLGNPIGVSFMGIYYWGLHGLPVHFQKALRLYRRAAAGGDADAMIALSKMHREGWGVPRDMRKAKLWLQRAADLGSAEAASKLRREGITR